MNKAEIAEVLSNNIEIIKHYGFRSQITIWIEEMSELTKELCKVVRTYDKTKGNINEELLKSVKEEIADVTICLDQLKYSIGYFENDLMEDYKYKVDRQLKRIKEENE